MQISKTRAGLNPLLLPLSAQSPGAHSPLYLQAVACLQLKKSGWSCTEELRNRTRFLKNGKAKAPVILHGKNIVIALSAVLQPNLLHNTKLLKNVVQILRR
jgi:hypothetical protein